MKRENKIITLVIAAIVLVAVLSYSLSTLMTSGTISRLQGAVQGANQLPSQEGTTVYKDWTQSVPLDNDYSYSTLVYTDDTDFYANISNENHNFAIIPQNYFAVDDKVSPVIQLWYPNDVAQLIITNCGYDKDGTSLSAVIQVSVHATYRDDIKLNPTRGDDGKMYYLDDGTQTELKAPLGAIGLSSTVIQNVTNDGKVVFTDNTWAAANGQTTASTGYRTMKNMPLAFNLNLESGSLDVKITYYRKLKLNKGGVNQGIKLATVDTANSTIATDITKINSAYNDFDTTPYSFANPDNQRQGYIDAGMKFEGNEGMKPLMGTSTLFYNKTGKQTLTPADYENTFIQQADKYTFNFRMTEKENGIFINPNYSQETKLHGKWENLVQRLMAQNMTRKQALDHYCKYVAQCTVAYDNSVNNIDNYPDSDQRHKDAAVLVKSVVDSSNGYFDTAGFSYLTSAQLLTTGVQGQFAFRYEMPGGGIKFGFLSPQGYKFTNPKKTVNKNTITVGEVDYFNIKQSIPNNDVTNSIGFNKIYPNVFSADYKMKSFKFEDSVDKRLTIVTEAITVTTSAGVDITKYFDITVDENNKVTATSKSSASTFFNSNLAYGVDYILSIPFMYVGSVDKYIEIPNKGKVTYRSGSDAEVTKETNEVKVTIGEKPVKLTYDCTTNGGQPEFDPITVDQVPATDVDLTKVCVREGYRFLGWTEKATDTEAMTTFTMPDKDTTIYGIYTTSTCDTELTSSVYKIDTTNYIVNVPYDETEDKILSNVTSKGEISISGDLIIVKCDGSQRNYTISRYWVAKTGNDIIRWTAIIAGTLLLGVVFLMLKIRMNKKENKDVK